LRSPLSLAVESGSTDTVRFLLQKKLVFSKKNDPDSPLFRAVKLDNKEIVDLLLLHDRFSFLDACTSTSGITPLVVAVQSRNTEIAETLIYAGADINVRVKRTGKTALWFAANQGDVATVKLLLSFGADTTISEIGNAENTPLSTAMAHGGLSYAKVESHLKIAGMLQARTHDGKEFVGALVDFIVRDNADLPLLDDHFPKDVEYWLPYTSREVQMYIFNWARTVRNDEVNADYFFSGDPKVRINPNYPNGQPTQDWTLWTRVIHNGMKPISFRIHSFLTYARTDANARILLQLVYDIVTYFKKTGSKVLACIKRRSNTAHR
jgi:hypothetical protein